jgi:hypothetical protein
MFTPVPCADGKLRDVEIVWNAQLGVGGVTKPVGGGSVAEGIGDIEGQLTRDQRALG